MKFYEKQKPNILDLISGETKIKMNWDMVSNGANVNEVFKLNPIGLGVFLQPSITMESVNSTEYLDDMEEWVGY